MKQSKILPTDGKFSGRRSVRVVVDLIEFETSSKRLLDLGRRLLVRTVALRLDGAVAVLPVLQLRGAPRALHRSRSRTRRRPAVIYVSSNELIVHESTIGDVEHYRML